MPLPVFVVDAFADAPFTGNPAAVVVYGTDPPADDLMRQIAAEMNLSETAFVGPPGTHPRLPGEVRSLRWFTPTCEVDLCGHATLAAVHVLAAERGEAGPFRFATRGGLLTCEAADGEITLDFPAAPASGEDPPPGLAAAFGVEPVRVARNRWDLLCELPDAAAVRGLRPDVAALAGLSGRGIIVTAAADEGTPGADFVSRFFAPDAGVPEDPVTGSAHCALAPWWADRLGRTELVGRQVGPRGGTVRCEVRGDRVRLTGRAVTTLRGELPV